MGVKASSYKLNIFCKKHPNYRANRASKCPSCLLIFIAKWQHDKTAEDRFKGFDPYLYGGAYVGLNFENAFRGIMVQEELAPSNLQFTKKPERMHYPGCPDHPSNREKVKGTVMDVGCLCVQASRE